MTGNQSLLLDATSRLTAFSLFFHPQRPSQKLALLYLLTLYILTQYSTSHVRWYLKVLSQQVWGSIRSLFDGEFYLQDDGAPCHRSKTVKDFIRQQHWETLDGPHQSPDLNPIENLWALLKKKVWNTNFSNTTELKAKIIAVWHYHIEKQLLDKLALSMPDRLRAVIKAQGGPTNY